MVRHEDRTMAQSIEATPTPALLIWARETTGLSTVAAARRLNMGPETLQSMEAGEVKPTMAQLRKMADLYKRCLAIFFLPAPPKHISVIADYRRFPKGVREPFSEKLRALIRYTRLRQQWAADNRKATGQAIPPIVGDSVTFGTEYCRANPVHRRPRTRGLPRVARC